MAKFNWIEVFGGGTGSRPWGAFILSALVVALGLGVWWGAHRFSGAFDWVAHTNEVRVTEETIYADLNEAESAHRAYLLSGDSQYRTQSLLAQAEALRLAEELPQLVADNPPQRARAEKLKGLIKKRFELVETVARVYEKQGFEKAHATWMSLQQGNPVPEQTRSLSKTIVQEEHALLRQRQADTQQAAGAIQAISLAGMALALVLVALNGMAFQRENRIRERARRETEKAHDEISRHLVGIEQDHQSTQALADFASLLQGCQDLGEIFKVASHSLPLVLPGTAGTIYLMRDSRDHAEAYADWGDFWKDRPLSIVPQKCWALRQGRAFQSHTGALCCPHRENLTAPGFSTCVPMMAQGSDAGVLFIEHPERWTGSALAEACAEQLALAISNLRLRETLRTQSLRDPLTGLSNRREVDEHLPKEIARAHRTGRPLSVMVLDIDHFKRFNDTHGHDAGDTVLREFAHTIKATMRTEDMVARLGGEEFLVLLPGTPVEEALVFAERLRQKVQAMEVMHKGATVGRVTTSIGISHCCEEGITPEQIVDVADAALYKAKSNGRNRVEIAQKGQGDLRAPPASCDTLKDIF